MRVLILGGTTEASALARQIAGDARLAPVLSLAGRTTNPQPQPIPTRTGGFGGIEGLVRFLGDDKVDAVVDATHPYADQMSAHAVAACRETGVPLASLVRPEWQRHADDRWHVVADAEAAARALGAEPRRVFLSLGRQEVHVFASAPQHHYLARLIERPEQTKLPPDLRLLQARGPFDRADEERLLRAERIDVVVSKNAGGTATYAKIEAARALGLPVVMIARPHKPAGVAMADVDACVAWLHGLAPRGV
ncbi:MAG: cobalt-precorrin-6A reductase [Reyranella sp.]|uniref:cobalt-precorrin-6A reductase n=1 Tax=Reyranella sp. TaxID=1929291 RepID=UPI001ACF9427|nr:cobalt-precorrin-6A reductase [Reyranella sp.]MBN9091044.1 cobalt-precorrin-6A reductase [Reyranella sp.]